MYLTKTIKMQKNNRIEMASKKREAAHLFIVKGLSQKEIAKIIGVSEVTMIAWKRKYKWDDKVIGDLNIQGGVSALMNRFFDYVQSTKPVALGGFKNLWSGFLKFEENHFS